MRGMTTIHQRLSTAVRIISAVTLLGVLTGCNSPTTPTPDAWTLSCPANISVEANAGTSPPVTYSDPIADGATAPVTVSCTPPSGASFASGATPILCTGRDARGRIATCGFTVTIVAIPVLSAVRFTAFGDSITYGVVSPRAILLAVEIPESYPYKLRTMLQARYGTQVIRVDNEGWPGERSVEGVSRLPMIIGSNRPEVLLLLEGANDLLLGGEREIPTIISSLRTMVRYARGQGVRVLLATHPPARPETLRGRIAPFIPPLNAQITSLASAEGATLVDLGSAFGTDTLEVIGQDGLHPTEQGYELMAKTFFDVVRQEFEPAAADAFPSRAGTR